MLKIPWQGGKLLPGQHWVDIPPPFGISREHAMTVAASFVQGRWREFFTIDTFSLSVEYCRKEKKKGEWMESF